MSVHQQEVTGALVAYILYSVRTFRAAPVISWVKAERDDSKVLQSHDFHIFALMTSRSLLYDL